MNEVATILITIPRKTGDPTYYTAMWAEQIVSLAKDLGYKVITVERDDTTYDNVSEAIKRYNPRVYIHYGHGCPLSLLGNNQCIVTRKYPIEQLLGMAYNDRNKLRQLITPVRTSSCLEGVCKLENDVCSPICLRDTNVHLLKNTIVIAVACHSAQQLGRCAISYGTETYIGYKDLMMFSVDTLDSHNLFRDVHTEFIKELLLGHSVKDAEHRMNILEDSLITKYKGTKYISLPLLWNKLNREILGNYDESIYG